MTHTQLPEHTQIHTHILYIYIYTHRIIYTLVSIIYRFSVWYDTSFLNGKIKK